MDKDQSNYIQGLKAGNRKVFEEIFNSLYEPLVRFCLLRIYNKDDAEEIVQDIFIKLWLKKKELNINTSLQAYLYRTAVNKIINYKQHLGVKAIHREHVLSVNREMSFQSDFVTEQEIQVLASKAINSMPEKRRMVYEMSRKDGLKYAEIAEKLGISVKTVEAHLSAALEQLRVHLKDYLPP